MFLLNCLWKFWNNVHGFMRKRMKRYTRYLIQITTNYINSLIELIQTNLTVVPAAIVPPTQFTSGGTGGISHHGPVSFSSIDSMSNGNSLFAAQTTSRVVNERVVKHFKNVCAAIRLKRDEEHKMDELEKRWTDVEL